MMGDQPLEVLKGALDEIIIVLKDDSQHKKREIEALVDSKISEDLFA
jgi:hypothetical protein